MEQDIVLALVVAVAPAFDFTYLLTDARHRRAVGVPVLAVAAAGWLCIHTQRSGAIRAGDV